MCRIVSGCAEITRNFRAPLVDKNDGDLGSAIHAVREFVRLIEIMAKDNFANTMSKLPSVRNLLRRIEINPNDPHLYQMLGRRYIREGEIQKAKKAYTRSLKLAPRDAWTHLYLGNLYFTIEQHRKALHHFKTAARLRPDVPMVFVCLGQTYEALGIDALATENYLHALDLDPTDASAKKNWRRWHETSKS